MAAAAKTFSESWYRVANQRICLRPGVRVRRQNYRGERWMILENPFSNNYFRLRLAAWEFVSRLQPDRTVEAVWQECLERFPDEAPGQEAVIHLLAQLYHANLLQYDLASDSVQLFERFKKRRQRELRFSLLNIMFMRFPLLDPDRFLVRAMPLFGKLISPLGAALWLVVIAFALKVVGENFDAIRGQTEGILAPGNLPLLYASLIFIKALHELGHAFFCRRFGGEVHVMGVMLMIFTPLPYVDATSSWGFRSRWKRVLVAAAGMIVELFVAALATFVWAKTGPGLIHSLTYNMMVVASVSTLIFNLNPLLRFDGYYILSDFLEIPNLNQRANAQLRHFSERWLFGVKNSTSPTQKTREASWLATYGVTSGIYRVLVFSGVLLAVADRFLIIGILMAAVCFISWVSVPIFRFLQYLSASPRLDRVRMRAVAVSACIAGLLVVLLGLTPVPNHFRAPGIVRASERTEIVNETPGCLELLLAQPGSAVKRGQALVKLRSPELELERTATRARLEEVAARFQRALKEESADLAPLSRLRESVADSLRKLDDDADRLVVRARHDGVWMAPDARQFVGRWMGRGSSLGRLINREAFEFSATVLQEDVDALFNSAISGAEIRLDGQVATCIDVARWRVIPGEQKVLPSPALGWKAGGSVPVAVDDPNAAKAAEPFFEVIAKLDQNSGATLADGTAGVIRFALPAEPLLLSWGRRLWQLFQKRYQI